jgi:NAD(P)-dependent dehydrogenase (short-subunit alcohol dehydrogenase family)
MAGLSPWPGIGPYNATKYAVVGISETLALELAATKVGVSVLCPGLVKTNIFTSQRNRPQELRNEARNPAARAATDEVLQQRGLDPAVVGELVADAIRDGTFWIFTHPELLDVVEERHERISDARTRRT